MQGSAVNLTMKLEAAFRKEGKLWLAWCPPLDVMTQAETKESAFRSLREAVQLWFESCIARDVLDKALIEAGFKKIRPGDKLPYNASVVRVRAHKAPVTAHTFIENKYIEVSIPAYIAAASRNLESRASR